MSWAHLAMLLDLHLAEEFLQNCLSEISSRLGVAWVKSFLGTLQVWRTSKYVKKCTSYELRELQANITAFTASPRLLTKSVLPGVLLYFCSPLDVSHVQSVAKPQTIFLLRFIECLSVLPLILPHILSQKYDKQQKHCEEASACDMHPKALGCKKEGFAFQSTKVFEASTRTPTPRLSLMTTSKIVYSADRKARSWNSILRPKASVGQVVLVSPLPMSKYRSIITVQTDYWSFCLKAWTWLFKATVDPCCCAIICTVCML